MSNQQKAARKRRDRRTHLLSLVPKGAHRIQVKDEKGKQRWRHIDQLADRDEIQTKKNGDPIVQMAKTGRPAVDGKTGPANAVIRKIMADKEKALNEDSLLNLVKSAPESADVLHSAMIGLAEEAGSIAFERREAERNGDPTSQMSTRRINAIKAVVDTWLRRKDQIVSTSLDLDSPAFQAVMGHVMETFRGCMVDAQIDDGVIRVVFSRLSKRVATDEWKSEAKNRVKRNV